MLNMEAMNFDTAQRVIDFTSGACFTMGGNLQKISKKIIIATPSNVELSGDFTELLGDDDSTDISSYSLRCDEMNKEEQMICSHLLDLAEACDRRGYPMGSDF